jgi:hypothetical protein
MSQVQLETILSISVVLLLLAASVNIWWILSGREIRMVRRAFARWVVWRWEKDHRVESYVKGLRELATNREEK